MRLLSDLPHAEATALVEQFLSPDRVPLRAVVPLHARQEAQETMGVPLRGGFFNPLPTSQNAPLRASQTSRIVLTPFKARQGTGEWSQFDQSFVDTVVRLGEEKCAPPIITWMPKGVHCIRPMGAKQMMVWTVKPHMAAIANRHLQAMRTKAAAGQGQNPYFDFNHDHGFAGEPTEFFWDEIKGICASVQWSPEAEAAILAQRCRDFSPHWTNQGEEFLGLRANCGGLLDRDNKPAFTKMPWILPMTKRKAMHASARRFLQSVEERSKHFSGEEFALVKAFDQIQAEQPELHAAYSLRNAIEDEHWKDTVLTHA